MTQLEIAIAFAAESHQGQFCDGEIPLPYIFHPVEVAANLRNIGGIVDEDMLIAAVLHDTIEHGGVSVQDLELLFGQRVAALVNGVTREEPLPAQTDGLGPDEIWSLRANMLLTEIATKMSDEHHVIKLADRLANLKEARRSKKGKKLKRYLTHTEAILRVIPKETNLPLWKAIKSLL